MTTIQNPRDPNQEIVKVTLREMSRVVKHHYRSELDGHERQYILNWKDDTAYLLRKTGQYLSERVIVREEREFESLD